MKREIKFRVYDSITKQIHQWWRVKKIGLSCFDLEHYNLMQYSGTKDKNGVEVYEGDIVSYIIDEVVLDGELISKRDYYIEQVIFYNGMFCFNEVDEIPFALWAECKEAELEVIGNIYENPELLK